MDDTSCTSVQIPVDEPNAEPKSQSDEMASSRLRDRKGKEVSRGIEKVSCLHLFRLDLKKHVFILDLD